MIRGMVHLRSEGLQFSRTAPGGKETRQIRQAGDITAMQPKPFLLHVSICASIPYEVHHAGPGTPFKPAVLEQALGALWRPFRGITKEGYVTGHWIDDDGMEFTDVCLKVVIDCDRSRLFEALKAVKRLGRRLTQRAMYFEVAGYDGVQILRIE
jgi:hypothetical protein